MKTQPGAKPKKPPSPGGKTPKDTGRPISRQGLIRIYLKYGPNQERVINGLRRISTPGRRQYTKSKNIPQVYGGLGVSIVSTPQGVMTGRHAYQQRVGGELLAYIW